MELGPSALTRLSLQRRKQVLSRDSLFVPGLQLVLG